MAIDQDFERTIYQRQAPPPPLFETFGDRVLRRAEDVLAGRECPWSPSVLEVRFLQLLCNHQGKDRTLSAGQLCEHLHIQPRILKELVHELRLTFGVQVGASRDADAGGYYLIATEAESIESTEQMLHQAVSMFRTVLVMRGGRDRIDEFLTQLRLELTQEDAR